MRQLVNLVLGALLGGLVGGGVGLLLAPKSGRAMRSDISDYADHVKTEVRRATDQRRVELERELAEMREPVRNSE